MKVYTSGQASKIVGWSAFTIRKHAAKLGIVQLDDDGLMRVWEAIEARAAEVQREAEGRENERRDDEETGVIPGGEMGQRPALSPHFFDEAKRPLNQVTDEDSLDRDAPQSNDRSPDRVEGERSDPRIAINARALRGLDAEIATREMELATMKRARAVLDRTEGSAT
jgi:hypothetical protein